MMPATTPQNPSTPPDPNSFSGFRPRAWVRPHWIALAFVTATCVFSFAFNHPFSTPKVLLLCCLSVIFVIGAKTGPAAPGPMLWMLMGWPLACLFWTRNIPHAIPDLMAWSMYAFILCWGIRPLGKRQRQIRTSLTVSGVLVAGYGLMQTAGWDFRHLDFENQATSFFGNPNFSAHFLLLALTLGRYPARWPGVFLRGILLVGIAVCASKLVWLVLFGLTLWWLIHAEKYVIVGLFAGLLIGSAVLGWIFFSHLIRPGMAYVRQPDEYVREFRQQPSLIADRDPWFRGKRLSLMARVVILTNATHMVPEYLWVGSGFSGFYTTYPRYAAAAVEDPLLNASYRPHHVHNVVLEGAINFGTIWMTLSCFILGRAIYRMRTGPYRRALIAQLVLALASLNYVNPVIVIFLLLLRPIRVQPRTAAGFRWHAPALPALVIGLCLLDTGWVADSQATWAGRIYPANAGIAYYQNREFDRALGALRIACLRDPYGPHSMFNVCQAALAKSQSTTDPWTHIALEGLWLCSRLFPDFEPAQREIEFWRDRPVWDGFSASYGDLDAGDAWRLQHEWIEKLRASPPP